MHAPLVVQAHVATVVPAFLIGLWILVFSRKGLRWHRAIGALFLTLMVTTAIITLFHPSPRSAERDVWLEFHASVRPLYCLLRGVRLMVRSRGKSNSTNAG